MRTARTEIDYDALVLDERVHGRVYSDPAIFEDEMVVGQITDELTQRGIWRQWKKIMLQGVEVPTRRRGNGNGTARRATALR